MEPGFREGEFEEEAKDHQNFRRNAEWGNHVLIDSEVQICDGSRERACGNVTQRKGDKWLRWTEGQGGISTKSVFCNSKGLYLHSKDHRYLYLMLARADAQPNSRVPTL